MTLFEAIENIGKPVTYTHPATGVTEPGLIRSVDIANRELVQVQYGANVWTARPWELELDRSRR